VVHKTEANDQWAFYQAKKIREHNAQLGATLLNSLASDPAKVAGERSSASLAGSARLAAARRPRPAVAKGCSGMMQP
jgi:hypothetical protein